MSKKVFTDGDILYASDVNQITTPIMDGANFNGHGSLINDNNLDPTSGNIKSTFYNFYNRFRISVLNGLSLSCSGGAVIYGSTVTNIAPFSFVVPDNSITYLYLAADSSGNISLQQGLTLPTGIDKLSVVQTSGGSVTSLTDLRYTGVDTIPAPTIPSVPIGTVLQSLQPTGVPPGYLECNGSTVSRLTYQALFNLLGTTYGSGDNLTTFNLPNCVGRFLISETSGIGLSGGSNLIPISTDNLPPHSHGINDPGHYHTVSQTPHGHNIYDPGHAHNITDPGHFHHWTYPFCGLDDAVGYYPANGNDDIGETIFNVDTDTKQTGIAIQTASTNISVTPINANVSINPSQTYINGTQNTGGGTPIYFIPPYITVRTFIKF